MLGSDVKWSVFVGDVYGRKLGACFVCEREKGFLGCCV